MLPRYMKYTIGLVLMMVLALGAVAQPQQVAHFWEKLPIFEAVFGFLGCLLIIFVSKALGHFFLQKKEDYYDD